MGKYKIRDTSFVACCMALIVAGCVNYSKEKQAKWDNEGTDDVAIFKAADDSLDFFLKIDSAFSHHSVNGRTSDQLYIQVGSLKKIPGKLSNILLKVNGKDTAFSMELYKFDTVIFGPGKGKYQFLIGTVQQ
jgi:hypothetical protein